MTTLDVGLEAVLIENSHLSLLGQRSILLAGAEALFLKICLCVDSL